MRQIKWFSVAAAAAIAATSGAQAAEPAAGANWYLGAGAGQARAKIGDSTVSTALAGTGASVATITRDETEFSYKLFTGYQYNRYLAFEVGYFNLGSFTFNATTMPAGTLNGAVKNTVGANFDVLGTLPLADRFSLFARAGFQSSKTRDLFSAGGFALRTPTPSKNLNSYKAGLGAGFDFTRNVGMRAEWERYRIGDGYDDKLNVDVYSLSLLYKF
jgi:OOP family OmpA-OmpF porin